MPPSHSADERIQRLLTICDELERLQSAVYLRNRGIATDTLTTTLPGNRRTAKKEQPKSSSSRAKADVVKIAGRGYQRTKSTDKRI